MMSFECQKHHVLKQLYQIAKQQKGGDCQDRQVDCKGGEERDQVL